MRANVKRVIIEAILIAIFSVFMAAMVPWIGDAIDKYLTIQEERAQLMECRQEEDRVSIVVGVLR